MFAEIPRVPPTAFSRNLRFYKVFAELGSPPKTHACPANPNVQITSVSAHICRNPWGPPHGFLTKPDFLQGFCRVGPTAKDARLPRKPKCANYCSFGTYLPKSLGSPPTAFCRNLNFYKVFAELGPPPKTHACPANPNVQITSVSAHVCQNPWGPPHGFLTKPAFLHGVCRVIHP